MNTTCLSNKTLYEISTWTFSWNFFIAFNYIDISSTLYKAFHKIILFNKGNFAGISNQNFVYKDISIIKYFMNTLKESKTLQKDFLSWCAQSVFLLSHSYYECWKTYTASDGNRNYIQLLDKNLMHLKTSKYKIKDRCCQFFVTCCRFNPPFLFFSISLFLSAAAQLFKC